MTQCLSSEKLRVLHGVTFVLLTASTWMIPTVRRWPWIWVAPLLAYFLAVVCIPPLRRSLNWLRVGRLSAKTVAATVGIMALTTLGLVFFHIAQHPDVHSLRRAIPFESMGGLIMAGVVFSIANALFEELIFRGVLYDALLAEWGTAITLIATTVLFGLGHLHGYPPGNMGVCMAAVFGFLMGLLRLWTGGLALPFIAHVGADATIYSLLVGGL